MEFPCGGLRVRRRSWIAQNQRFQGRRCCKENGLDHKGKMTALRYLLLIVTAVCFGYLTYELWTPPFRPTPWYLYGIWVSLILIYVVLSGRTKRSAGRE